MTINLRSRFALRAGAICGIVAVLLAVPACRVDREEFGPTETKTQSVPLSGAKSANVHLEIAAGDLNVHGGAADLMNGSFTYSGRRWEPQIKYDEADGIGQLDVDESTEGNTHITTGHSRNSWNLALNDKIPIDLHTEMGAGRTELSLADISLRSLHVEVGAGEGMIDLAGNWDHDVDVNVEGGVGKVTIKLPRGMGVRVTVQGGIGSVHAPDFHRDGDEYVNDAAGKSAATINVQVQGGVGTVVLELSGGSTV